MSNYYTRYPTEGIEKPEMTDEAKQAIWNACLACAQHRTEDIDDVAVELIRAHNIIFAKTVRDQNPYRLLDTELYRENFLHPKAVLTRRKESSGTSH